MLKIGNKNIADIRLGEAHIAAVYRGEKLVWQKQAAKPLTVKLRLDNGKLYAEIAGETDEGYALCRWRKGRAHNSSTNHYSNEYGRYIYSSKEWHMCPSVGDGLDGQVYTTTDGEIRMSTFCADGEMHDFSITDMPHYDNFKVTADGSAYRIRYCAASAKVVPRIAGKKVYNLFGIVCRPYGTNTESESEWLSNIALFKVVYEVQPDLSLKWHIEI